MRQTTQSLYDLGYYFSRFPDALKAKYGKHFDSGQNEIERRFEEVRSGSRLLTIEDVMELFDPSLPFVCDWTKPDRDELARKMNESGKDLAMLVYQLGDSRYNRGLITEILVCFRELSLTALVLHHVYPDRFAICSHHLASRLHITGSTVPEFYIEYCKELEIWSQHEWKTPGTKSVVDAEFALWTWYKFAFSDDKEGRTHRTNFFDDRWVQGRRAIRVASSLGPIGKLDLARSYLDTDPTVAAMIACRELEIRLREIIGKHAPARTSFQGLIDRLTAETLPPLIDKEYLHKLRGRRNGVVHDGVEIEKIEAGEILDTVTAFVETNATGPAAL